MTRYEITGTATDIFTLRDIQAALRDAGAVRVLSRNAFGWRNQPRAATFSAPNDDAAKRIADDARKALGRGSLPALLPRPY